MCFYYDILPQWKEDWKELAEPFLNYIPVGLNEKRIESNYF